jgi:3-oxoacyl-[acyl-carrier protein] reductase
MDGQPIAIVTGICGGIGRAIAAKLRAEGYRIVGVDLLADAEGLADVHYRFDLSNLGEIPQLWARIESEVGPVAVLVNNAGHVTDGSFAELTADEIMMTLTVNVAAVMLLSRAAADSMAARGRGAIVNLASIAGERGSSQAAYGASKAGVINLTRTMARLYASGGVRINAVAPGFVNAGMGERLPEAVRGALLQATAMGRGAEAEEIAQVVAFLASDAASFMTAETVCVHGGI